MAGSGKATIFEKACQGDPPAITEMLSAEHDSIVRMCERVVIPGDSATECAEGLANEVYLKARDSLLNAGNLEFANQVKLRAWLRRIVRSVFIDQVRRGRVEQGARSKYFKKSNLAMVNLTRDDGTPWVDIFHDEGPHREEERYWINSIIVKAAKKMKRRDQEIILKKYLEGKSPADIAADLAITKKAAQSRIDRARANMATAIAEDIRPSALSFYPASIRGFLRELHTALKKDRGKARRRIVLKKGNERRNR